ncbi:MAG: thiamine phosphate synthase [Hyphomicrobiaceae bacterium]
MFAGLDVFYPIVPDVAWLERIVPLGVRTVQLRVKDAQQVEVRAQVREALALTSNFGCQLIVNDHWQIALDLGADYIHLGQEDLADADRGAIARCGARLGLSTHNSAELETALAAKPDYVALGPVYETKLKTMKWAPQGLERVTEWKRRVGALPLVGIAGITVERAPGVFAAGADSVAVITDFLTHADPPSRVRQWVEWAGHARKERSRRTREAPRGEDG